MSIGLFGICFAYKGPGLVCIKLIESLNIKLTAIKKGQLFSHFSIPVQHKTSRFQERDYLLAICSRVS